VLVVGALFLLGVLAEVPGLNGPWYWKWNWRDLEVVRTLRLLAFFSAPLLAYAYLLRRWSCQPAVALSAHEAARIVTGLAICAASFPLAAVSALPRTWWSAVKIVRSDGATGYFTDAMKIASLSDFLANFATLARAPHSVTHPPGPILFWLLCIRLVGDRFAPLLGCLLIGLGVGLGVAVLYEFAGLWTTERHTRLGPCFLYALLPGPIVFLPELDQLYPMLSMSSLLFWDGALKQRRWVVGWLGLTLFLASFMAYNLLTMGAPMLLYALVVLHRERWTSVALHRCAVAALGVLSVGCGAYGLLWVVTSFDPIASLREASRHMESSPLNSAGHIGLACSSTSTTSCSLAA
jgi:hypothetical protein